MTDRSRNNAPRTRGRPFRKGNPGRPRGARHRVTVAAEALLHGEAETLTRKVIELALGGDRVALRLCLDRILPPRRERSVPFKLPSLRAPADATFALSAIAGAVATAEITPGEAAELAKLVEAYVKALEAGEFDLRLQAVEARDDAKKS
jgi:hypothetical protein